MAVTSWTINRVANSWQMNFFSFDKFDAKHDRDTHTINGISLQKRISSAFMAAISLVLWSNWPRDNICNVLLHVSECV